MSRLRRALATLAVATVLTTGLAACSPSTSEPPAPAPAPVVLTGIVTDAASYGGDSSTVIVEVQNPDGERTVYSCEPYWDKVCPLLKRGDAISFTQEDGNSSRVRDVKRTKAIADTTNPISKR